MEHRPGKQHSNADALSRRPCLKDRCRKRDKAKSKESAASEVKPCAVERGIPAEMSEVKVYTAELAGLDIESKEIPVVASLEEIAEAQNQDVDIGPVVR